jgi:predicted Zn-dependent peptidase
MFWVRTGARDETPAEGGISHFLEHMAFKRTKTRTYEQINREFEEIGAENNAFTWLEMTVYHARALGDRLDHMVELLADLTHPVLDEGDFDQERSVILEEIARHRDQPYSLLLEEFFRIFFPDQPLGLPTLGSPETIKAMTVQQMQSYWQRRYGAANMLFSVAGNFDWEHVTGLVGELTADWHGGDIEPSHPGLPAAGSTRVVTDERWNQQHFVLGVNSISQGSPDYYTAAVLANILGDDTGSRLFWSVNQTGLADQVGASVMSFQDTGVLFALAVTDPDRAAEALRVISDQLAKLQAGPIEEDELARAKMKLLTSTVIEGESARARMMGLAESWLSRGRLETLAEVQASIEAVTTQGVMDFLGRHPLTDGHVLAALGPLAEDELILA